MPCLDSLQGFGNCFSIREKRAVFGYFFDFNAQNPAGYVVKCDVSGFSTILNNAVMARMCRDVFVLEL
jgi:hypothetical protein